MKNKIILLILAMMLPAVAVAHEQEKTPHLWSWFKKMNKSSAACKIQSEFILDKMKAGNIVHNDHGVYAVYKKNRIVVKCLSQDDSSVLWVAVAGMDKDSVELLRNKIVGDIK